MGLLNDKILVFRQCLDKYGYQIPLYTPPKVLTIHILLQENTEIDVDVYMAYDE